MTRLFTCGFEENNLTATMWDTATGSPSIVTTPVNAGTYALLTNGGSAGDELRRDFSPSLSTGQTIFMRAYFRFTSATGQKELFWLANSTGATQACKAEINGQNIELKNPITPTTQTGSVTLSVDTWYRAELSTLLSDTVGTGELRVYLGDATTPLETLTLSGEDTWPSTPNFRIGNRGSGNSGDVYFDDIAINDDTGSFQNSFPGPGKIFLLEPAGDVSVTATPTPSSPATNWDKVDDLPGAPDDATSYVDFGSATTDRYSMTNLGAEVPSDADIILLDVYARTGSDGTTGNRVITLEIWDDGGTNTTGPTCSTSISGWRIIDTGEHLVLDAGAKSKSDVDSFDVGATKSGGGGNARWMSAEWVNVEWIESAGGRIMSSIVGPGGLAGPGGIAGQGGGLAG